MIIYECQRRINGRIIYSIFQFEIPLPLLRLPSMPNCSLGHLEALGDLVEH